MSVADTDPVLSRDGRFGGCHHSYVVTTRSREGPLTTKQGERQSPVVILCGGQGTRIREVSERLPKAMVDIGGRPVLWHIMKLYSHYGFRRFILCLGYKGWEIK